MDPQQQQQGAGQQKPQDQLEKAQVGTETHSQRDLGANSAGQQQQQMEQPDKERTAKGALEEGLPMRYPCGSPMEPSKSDRPVEAEEGDGKEEVTEQTAEEGKPVALRKDCVKDENGFTYYKCRFCGLTFNYMTTLKAHERVHDIEQPYTCNKCGEAFHYMCELEYHAKTHLAQKGYKCECGRTFFQYTDLLYHRHPGEDAPEPTFALPPSAPTQPIHQQLMPSTSVPAISSAEFPTPEFAERGFEPKHQMRVWSDVRSKPYICQYCSKSYSDSRGLAYHMYSHRGERIFNPRASRYLMCRNDNSYISPGLDLKDA